MLLFIGSKTLSARGKDLSFLAGLLGDTNLLIFEIKYDTLSLTFKSPFFNLIKNFKSTCKEIKKEM
jgi:hypothetical protein